MYETSTTETGAAVAVYAFDYIQTLQNMTVNWLSSWYGQGSSAG
jgi:hypothetical protein